MLTNIPLTKKRTSLNIIATIVTTHPYISLCERRYNFEKIHNWARQGQLLHALWKLR